jgi:ABC-2 type transport system ATP-binding protein
MIQVNSLEYSYKKGEKTIDGLSFEVPEGSFFGFLGANGSGKTTTIRLMLGLCKPDKGFVKIGGEEIRRSSVKAFRRIGSMIESPSYYANLTGEENLLVYSRYYGLDKTVIDKTLKDVGLSQAASKKAGSYSLGMKQRLGMAISIMHNPDLLILDEPLNGLDPKGISDIRDLLLRLQKEEGKTIFISSHLLGEIENTCENICVIDKGKKLFSGRIEDLRTSIIGKTRYSIECNKREDVSQILKSDFDLSNIIGTENIEFSVENKDIIPEIVRKLNTNDVSIYGITRLENSLEELFLKLTNS